EEIHPSLVVPHDPEQGVHPDHNPSGHRTLNAAGERNGAVGRGEWPAAIATILDAVHGQQRMRVAVREEFDLKLNAIFKEKSQAECMREKLNETPEGLEEYIEGLNTRLGLERFFVWNYAK